MQPEWRAKGRAPAWLILCLWPFTARFVLFRHDQACRNLASAIRHIAIAGGRAARRFDRNMWPEARIGITGAKAVKTYMCDRLIDARVCSAIARSCTVDGRDDMHGVDALCHRRVTDVRRFRRCFCIT